MKPSNYFHLIFMALPGHRRTSSHKRRRASHFALTPNALQHCPKCDKPVRPHRACPFCGFYKGREVVKMGKKKPVATVAKKTPAKKTVKKTKKAAPKA